MGAGRTLPDTDSDAIHWRTLVDQSPWLVEKYLDKPWHFCLCSSELACHVDGREEQLI
jgi:hypothetical protein